MSIRKIIVACGLCAGMFTAAIAQQLPDATATQSVKGAQLKGKAPINSKSLAIDLPKPVEATLKNGMRVVLIEDRKLPTLYVQSVLLQRGDGIDPKDLQGVARMVASQLREGTRTRTARELSERLDSLGGSLNGFTTPLDSYLTLTGLSEHADALLELFADVLVNPIFPADELERAKARYVSQLQAQRATPTFIAREQLYKSVYGEHPASVVAPAEEHVTKITQADVQTFHARYYRPNAAYLFVAGDISMAQLLPKLERAFEDWATSDVSPAPMPEVKSPEKGAVFVLDRPGSVQTSLLLGALSIKGDDADRSALIVANQVLGAGPASRLFMNLREDKGYTYGAYSNVSMGRYPGVVAANAEVRTEVTDGAMKEFMFEINRLISEPVGAVELANAKRALVGRFALALEEPRSFIGYVFEQKIYDFPSDYWDHYAERIDAITAADVQRVAAKYFDPKRMQIVAVGDASKIKDVMEQYKPGN